MKEPTMIGVSEKAHAQLKSLVEDKYFAQMLHAYRFGIAYSLSQGVNPPEISSKTVFAVSTVDPDQSIKSAINTLVTFEHNGPIYELAERLADYGVKKMAEMAGNGSLNIQKLLEDSAKI